MRRDQLKPGVVWQHQRAVGTTLFISLSEEDAGKLGKGSSDLWSISLSTARPEFSLVFTYRDDRTCEPCPPTTLTDVEISRVLCAVEWAAKRGVKLTPLCGLLYKEGVNDG